MPSVESLIGFNYEGKQLDGSKIQIHQVSTEQGFDDTFSVDKHNVH